MAETPSLLRLCRNEDLRRSLTLLMKYHALILAAPAPSALLNTSSECWKTDGSAAAATHKIKSGGCGGTPYPQLNKDSPLRGYPPSAPGSFGLSG